MFKLGEVKLPTDDDFNLIKNLCLNDNDWFITYAKSNIKVFTKKNELSSFHMIKVKADFDDISAKCLYNVIQDGEYRAEWDDKMAESIDICYISPFSDIGYYAIKSPKPIKNRDFVTQRCWLDFGENQDKIVFNHSINHSKFPPKKGCIRGISYLTATLIQSKLSKGCTFYYVTQSDPGGSLPSWIVNMTTKVYAPKLIKKIHKACLKYEKWKSKNNSNYMPWVNPEQFRIPKIDWNDIQIFDRKQLEICAEDESQITENDVDYNEINEDKNDD